MSDLLSILTPDNDPTGYLRKKAKPVTEFSDELKQIITQLHQTLNHTREVLGFGRALAAPQTGISLRIIVMNLGAGPITLINPEITWCSDEMQQVWDDCLSTPEVIVNIARHVSISLRFQDPEGIAHHWEHLPADLSELLQHEYEHLDGILMIDHSSSDNTRPASEKHAVVLRKKEHRISLSAIQQAAIEIDPVFTHSPLSKSDFFSRRLSTNIWLKDETQNPIGCFKGRGAENFFSSTKPQNNPVPIVCASVGNWGLALAWSCHKRNFPLYVFVSENANQNKVQKIKALGAKIITAGNDFDAAKQKAKDFSIKKGYDFLEDGKDVSVSEGAGSIAVELFSNGKHFDAVYVPLGNGALINGVSRWIKACSPMTKVIGVVPEGADSMFLSWKQGQVILRETVNTIADGLAVRTPIPEAVGDMKGIVDDIILVSDKLILKAMEYAEKNESIILEPSGAAGLAGILSDRNEKNLNGNIAVLLTGANRA
ncbi:pyridoxal-phosphate dependent enzyme [Vibrio salinus]|uniref:pyridoxal-phosphate dependent enzyme n=1 Tax=Vibrio salinus TaxID=2899784 RepID=UPI001E38671F|nr:pyridoxal-phosphate dependent enzyme [Vibrio salinus]MCE0494872.1 pyridoxal-phosphate dependent enzyme [Vibrio salinus]